MIQRVDEITDELTLDLLQANDYWLYALKLDGSVDYKVKSSTLQPVKTIIAQTVGEATNETIITISANGAKSIRIYVEASNAGKTKGYITEKKLSATAGGVTNTTVVEELSDFDDVEATVEFTSSTEIKITLTGETGETVNFKVRYEILYN